MPSTAEGRADKPAPLRTAVAYGGRRRGGFYGTYKPGRVTLGGLLAGLVINIVEFITNGVVLREAWGQAMQALGKPAQLSAGAIVIFNIWGFLLGIAAVWLYAAIRPRYGAGPMTAMRAGLVTWAIAVFLANLSNFNNYPLGLFPTRLLVITSIVALVKSRDRDCYAGGCLAI